METTVTNEYFIDNLTYLVGYICEIAFIKLEVNLSHN